LGFQKQPITGNVCLAVVSTLATAPASQFFNGKRRAAAARQLAYVESTWRENGSADGLPGISPSQNAGTFFAVLQARQFFI
jgi:hypothetical protein